LRMQNYIHFAIWANFQSVFSFYVCIKAQNHHKEKFPTHRLPIKQKALPLHSSPTLKPAQGGREVADIDGKASLVRFVLDSSESCTFESRQRQGNDRCLCGYVIIQCARQPLLHGCLSCVDMHIGVGFSVARSDEKGSARALRSGTSRQKFPAPFYFCP